MAIPRELEALLLDIPFHKFLGLRITEMAGGRARAEMPFRPELIGDPLRPAIHGGVLATILDACGGFAVWGSLTIEDRVSTIDLRIDYLAPAAADALVAEANVVRVGNRVAVVDIRLWQPGKPELIVATGKGVYNVRRAGE
jgi:uncharacterized protein (TIGR00369 family)